MKPALRHRPEALLDASGEWTDKANRLQAQEAAREAEAPPLPTRTALPARRTVTPADVLAILYWRGATVEGPELHEFVLVVEGKFKPRNGGIGRGAWVREHELRRETALAFKIIKGRAVMFLRAEQPTRLPYTATAFRMEGGNSELVLQEQPQAYSVDVARNEIRALLVAHKAPDCMVTVRRGEEVHRFSWDAKALRGKGMLRSLGELPKETT